MWICSVLLHFFKKIKNDITHQKITKQLFKMFLVNFLMQSIFAKLFTGLLPLNDVFMCDGILNLSLHLPSVDFN